MIDAQEENPFTVFFEPVLGFVAEAKTLGLCIADLESKLPELRKSHPELMGETS